MQHIFLIDDDEDDREFFLSVIESIDRSLSVQTSANGAMALHKLTIENFQPDIIFLDLNMPVMSGRQFLSEVKKQHHLKAIPVVILSTSSDQTTIDEMKYLGASDFITKPNKLTLLETRLRQLFRDFQSPR